MVKAVEESYADGVTDEFIKPIHNSSVNGCIEEGDVVIFINFRNDRAKELTIVLTQQDMPEQGMKTIPGLQYYCMTPYDASFTGVNILFPKENVENTLGEYLSQQGKKQLHTAETEKYAHVTFFFNGGREAPYEGEDRILVPSPKVATYDLKPEMSAYEVKDKLVAAINENKYDFIVVNFANGDMVGHTGVYNAIAKAVWGEGRSSGRCGSLYPAYHGIGTAQGHDRRESDSGLILVHILIQLAAPEILFGLLGGYAA